MWVTADRVLRFPSLVLRLLVASSLVALSSSAIQAAFPDAHNAPPAGWTGPVFTLSQAYPATLPALEPISRRPWTQFDFRDPAQAPEVSESRPRLLPCRKHGDQLRGRRREHGPEVVPHAVAALGGQRP